MADLQDTINLANKLKEATPVAEPQETSQVNLSSSYLSSNWNDAKSDAFLNDATIETKISSVVATSSEIKQQAENAGLSVEAYDPMAEEKARAEAEARARQIAEQQQREKFREEQKEKLLLFLKWENTKNKRVWYLRWVLSWIALTLWVIAFTVIFAKDQAIDFISNGVNSFLWQKQNISASVVDLNYDENVDDENVGDENVSDETSDDENISDETSDDENVSDETSNDESVSDETSDDENVSDETSNDENIGDETSDLPFFSNPEITDDKLNSDSSKTDQENTLDDENVSDENISWWETDDNESGDKILEPTYVVTRVSSPSEANWVISANCDALSCGDYTKATEDLTLCKNFKQKEDLSDDANRIGTSGICRYRDESELVYLSLQ